MTINVGLVTSEALILGCDSIASSSRPYLNPLRFAKRAADGSLELDAEGRYVATFKYEDLDQVVANAWGGVQKMFPLCDGTKQNETHVAAVTAGLAKLQERTMSSLAAEFRKTMQGPKKRPKHTTVKDVADAFLAYMRQKYGAHYVETGDPVEFQEEIEFLVGGYGNGDSFPSLYRVRVKENNSEPLYAENFKDKSGLAWAGQADSVQRLLRGCDTPLIAELFTVIEETHKSMGEAAVRILNDALTALQAVLPGGINTELPSCPTREAIGKILRRYVLDIDYPNLPLQDAVEFVSFLVRLQAAKAKYALGVPTVGGRIHIGVVTRTEGFRMLNEPELMHKDTGFTHDL
jgi:hypothetical protein